MYCGIGPYWQIEETIKEDCDVEYLFALNRAREWEKERMRLRTYLIENVQEIWTEIDCERSQLV